MLTSVILNWHLSFILASASCRREALSCFSAANGDSRRLNVGASGGCMPWLLRRHCLEWCLRGRWPLAGQWLWNQRFVGWRGASARATGPNKTRARRRIVVCFDTTSREYRAADICSGYNAGFCYSSCVACRVASSYVTWMVRVSTVSSNFF